MQSSSPSRNVPSATTSNETSSGEAALRSVHTASLPQILTRLQSSLMLTTYQAGKVVILRNEQSVLNTHFRHFNSPMGLAIDEGRLAIGGEVDIWEFHNVPEVARKLQPDGSHDAAFLPRRVNVTGDVRIHEMAWVHGTVNAIPELWFVNTAFSCLAVRSDEYSFEPRWQPSFLSQLQPGDHCHLNGMAVRDDRVRYVTALGESQTPGGWRDNKRDGGVLIDVETDEIITRGLSMPHSPRWHQEQLWILNSGEGGLGTIDLNTGRYQEITRLPGFTRGLTLVGDLAFVGLSQVRESAVFSGIPLCDSTAERKCGVWVVDVSTGQTVALVEFTDAVQEIFAVEMLRGVTWPDLVNEDPGVISSSYVLSDAALRQVPEELRSYASE